MTQALNFVLCPSYHGATLFGLLANNHDMVTALGDTLPIREHMDYFCSCHERIEACEFWQTLGRELCAERFPKERKLVPTVPRVFNSYQINNSIAARCAQLAVKFHINPWWIAPRLTKEFREVTEQLAEVACRLQGTRVFVDGSKEVYRVLTYLLVAKPELVRIIHLVRDPRGFALSSDVNLADRNLPSDHPMIIWNGYHEFVMCYLKPYACVEYLRVRYEDLCAAPEPEMNRVFGFLGLDDQNVTVAPTEPHHLIGNRMLLEFDGTVTLDTRWEDHMSEARRTEVLQQTHALAAEFGYV